MRKIERTPLDKDGKLILLKSIQQGYIDIEANPMFWQSIDTTPPLETRLEWENALFERLTAEWRNGKIEIDAGTQTIKRIR